MGKALNNKRKLGEYAENLGALAGDPTTRIDGTALQAGDTYFKTGEGAKVYDGSAFVSMSGGGGGGSVAWADITGKPSTFTPSAHTHTIVDVTGLQTALDGKAPSTHAHVATDISDSTTVGRAVLTAADAAAARTAIGAGTSSTTGTVTAVSVASANGFAGTVATATSTPAITLTTSLTGLLKGNGTAMVAATAGTDYVAPGQALGTPSSGTLTNCTADGTNAVGFRNVPQVSRSAAYTAVLDDAGKHILHPSADTTARTFTIPANASVAYPIGTAITFVNQASAGAVTIAIATDTMRLAGAGTTGSRTLAANGIATALKIAATEWIISGTGLT